MAEETSLIANTKFEELLLSYRHQKVSSVPRNRHVVTQQIKAAFNFLLQAGKPYSNMTLEEFEIAHEEIKRRAGFELARLEQELKKCWRARFIKRPQLAGQVNIQKDIKLLGYNTRRFAVGFSETLERVGLPEHMASIPPNFERLVEEIVGPSESF